MDKAKLFGTDGIRQEVGRFPLDDASIVNIGRAFGESIPTRNAKIVIGRDTRSSGEPIEKLISAGIACVSERFEILSCGVIPTPGLSFLTERGAFDYGIMITASHNPYTDNGIKMFGSDGEKISERMEEEIEQLFFQNRDLKESRERSTPNVPASMNRLYLDFLMEHAAGIDLNSNGTRWKIVLDCSNGATYELAPRIFKEAGFNILPIHSTPDGENINRECGSAHIRELQEKVVEEKADLGIAFDGDGDRVIMVDSLGRPLDGDYSLVIISELFLETRDDFNKIVVGTIMGNLGLEKALEQRGIRYPRTSVGDKYVYREMKRTRAILGGEQSGHTILRCFQKTGDGILTALYFLKSLERFKIAPMEIFDRLTLYPQVNRDIPICEKKDLAQWVRLNEMIREFEDANGSNSRLVIRYSGTEPKLRLMMESQSQAIIDENMPKFEKYIRSTIGIK